jgi:polyferredoxin
MNDTVLKFCVLAVLAIWFIIVGRLFCGKACPAGYAQDLIFKIPFFVKIKTFKFDKYVRLLKYCNIFINFLLLPVLAFAGLYHIAQGDGQEGPPKIIIFIMIIIAIIIRRPFCKYFCPVGSVSSLFNKISFYKYKTLNDKCIQCGICSKKCKMNIIPYKTNNSLECIRCGYCKKVCPKNAIITGFNIKNGINNKEIK